MKIDIYKNKTSAKVLAIMNNLIIKALNQFDIKNKFSLPSFQRVLEFQLLFLFLFYY